MTTRPLPPRDAHGRFIKAGPRRRAARTAAPPPSSPVRFPDAWYGAWYRRVLLWLQIQLWGDHQRH